MFNQLTKKQNFNIKLSVEEAKKLLQYLEDEFMESYDEFLETLEEGNNDNNEEFQYYDDIRVIIEDLSYDLHKEIRNKERTSMRVMDSEDQECENISKKLNKYSLEVLKKIENLNYSIYRPLLYRFFYCLYNSFDKSGEIIFTQNSLENLLDLDRYKLEKFLERLSSIEVKVGNKRGKIVEKYRFLNSSTVKIEYNLHIVNPMLAEVRDKEFHIEKIENIAAFVI